ncbi:MAG: cytochrome P450 [Dehalococcoidia bacterium]
MDAPVVPFDVLAPEVLADPAAAYGQLREAGPVHWYPGLGGFFVLTRYADVSAALRDHETWSFRWGGGPQRSLSGGLFSDPPEHTLFRRMLGPAHTPAAVAKLEGWIEGLAASLIDAMVETGSPADLHDSLAVPLPVNVIAEMMGVPAEQRSSFKAWSDASVVAMNSGNPRANAEVMETIGNFFGEMIDARMAALAEWEGPVTEELLGAALPADLVSRLAIADATTRPTTRQEMIGVLHQQLIGGNETTTSLITNVVTRLLERPELLDAVRADPGLVEVALEESLRFDPPVLGLYRTNDRPVSVGGVTIPIDSKVLMLYATANRDSRAWDDPDTFRLDRGLPELRRKQLSFGAGIHTCQGSSLARLESRIALRLIVDRFPGLRSAGATERVKPFLMWGRARMPIAWDPA